MHLALIIVEKSQLVCCRQIYKWGFFARETEKLIMDKTDIAVQVNPRCINSYISSVNVKNSALQQLLHFHQQHGHISSN